MAFRFDFGETFSRAAHAAEEVAKGASEVIGSAAKDAASAVGGIAVGAAMGLAQGASSLASGAASTVEGGINAIKENSFSARLRKARIKGFRDGIKQGAYLAGQKRTTSSTPTLRRSAS